VNAPDRIASALVVTLVIGSSWLLFISSRETGLQATDSHQPELYVSAPKWDLFDDQGRLSQRLRSTRIEQWHDEEGLRLLDPEFSAWRDNGMFLQATARKGRLHEMNRPAELQDDVVLTKIGPAEENRLILKTGHLLIDPSGNRIETGEPVTLQTGRWKFTADGLLAEFESERLQLTGRVRGIHD
jgi:lipopolysaccharide export system protein LptC